MVDKQKIFEPNKEKNDSERKEKTEHKRKTEPNKEKMNSERKIDTLKKENLKNISNEKSMYKEDLNKFKKEVGNYDNYVNI